MSFLELQFPPEISYGASFGPGMSTDVVVVTSGSESRNQNWADAKLVADVSHGVKSQAQLDQLIAFFRVAGGRANGFRVKDWTDFAFTHTNGRLGTAAAGTGVPTYQLYKRYSNAAGSYDRALKKPVASPAVLRGGAAVTYGGGAGQIALNSTTGIFTFVADATSAASSITVGATTTVILAANPGTLTSGQRLHLSGFTGADAALVNGLAHTINSVSGAGPFTFVLATNTAGKVITLGSGLGAKYPQTTETLTAAGEFDVPMRFDTDQMMARVDSFGVYSWGSIPLVEDPLS